MDCGEPGHRAAEDPAVHGASALEPGLCGATNTFSGDAGVGRRVGGADGAGGLGLSSS